MLPFLMQPHHLESLGWTLIHFCWQAAAIAILYKVVDFAFAKGRNATSHARYLFALRRFHELRRHAIRSVVSHDLAHFRDHRRSIPI